jgi:hypothetical protein
MLTKRFGIGTLILALLLMSMALVPAASDEEIREDVDGSEVNLTIEEESVVIYHSDPITQNNPYWYLLMADTTVQL